MKFIPKYMELQAEQLTEAVIPNGVTVLKDDKYVKTSHGDFIHVKNGMWIAEEPNGKGYYPIKDEIIQSRWIPKGEFTFLKRIFDWESLEVDDTYIQFEDCKLQVPLGAYEAGEEFEVICLFFLTGELKLYKNGTETTVQLELTW